MAQGAISGAECGLTGIGCCGHGRPCTRTGQQGGADGGEHQGERGAMEHGAGLARGRWGEQRRRKQQAEWRSRGRQRSRRRQRLEVGAQGGTADAAIGRTAVRGYVHRAWPGRTARAATAAEYESTEGGGEGRRNRRGGSPRSCREGAVGSRRLGGGRSPQRRDQRRRGRRGQGRRWWGRGGPASGASGRKARRPSSDGRRRGGGSVTGQPGVESGTPPARWGAGFGPIQIERWRWDRGKWGVVGRVEG